MVLILSWGGMLVSHVKPVSLGVLCVSSDTADSSIHGMSLLNSFRKLFTSLEHSLLTLIHIELNP